LVVSLIMLVLVTFIVVNAFNMSSSNLKAVSNEQLRSEATAAANRYIEELISTPAVFTNSAPGGYERVVNLNGDATQPNNYTVRVAEPVCIRAHLATSSAPSDVELGAGVNAVSTWDVEFEFAGTVTDDASGTSVEIRQGIRVRLSQFQKTAKCS
jgi:Tfp pilus assembly protein PilX